MLRLARRWPWTDVITDAFVRLQIRAGHTDDARQRLLDLYEAVGTGSPATFEGITVPANLTRTDEDRRQVHAWLWRVLLADGTRALITTGRWPEALAHIEQHRGIGTRMLDGRQVAVVAALAEGDTECAPERLPARHWASRGSRSSRATSCRDVGQPVDGHIAELINAYLEHEARPGLTVFDTRLGLTVLDSVGTREHPEALGIVEDIVR
jgi:hypothetical protein